jgi:hypothetical protein
MLQSTCSCKILFYTCKYICINLYLCVCFWFSKM